MCNTHPVAKDCHATDGKDASLESLKADLSQAQEKEKVEKKKKKKKKKNTKN